MGHVYKWRSDIGAEAIEAVKKFWSDEHLIDRDDRAVYAKMLLKPSDAPYLYGSITTKMQNGDLVIEVRGSNLCALLLSLIGHHIETSRAFPASRRACSFRQAPTSNPVGHIIWPSARCAPTCIICSTSFCFRLFCVIENIVIQVERAWTLGCEGYFPEPERRRRKSAKQGDFIKPKPDAKRSTDRVFSEKRWGMRLGFYNRGISALDKNKWKEILQQVIKLADLGSQSDPGTGSDSDANVVMYSDPLTDVRDDPDV